MLKRGKKGVEPIIATILVIGFVIIIAVAVFTWGDQLVKLKIGESDEEAEAALKCLQTSFNVKSSCIFGPSVQLFLENTGRQDITSFKYAITGETRKAEDIKTSLPVYAAATIPFKVPEALGTAGSIDIYPQVTIKDKAYTCKQPTKNELKDCFAIFNLQSADEFTLVSGDAEKIIAPREGYKEALKSYPEFELQTDLSLPKNILFVGKTNDENAIVQSKSFTIPNDERIKNIGLYAETNSLNSRYYLVKSDGSEKNLADIRVKIGQKTSFEYRNTIYDPNDINVENLLGQEVKLGIELTGGAGYTALLRFCYTDGSGICLSK
ncbi:MAG: archaellin/type IV pilin N-terminal domain-containing protein [Candidatus Nanoarchaeia archaeon]